jgi:uncharacterized protein (TIGR01777 family)
MRILITGIRGCVGKSLANHLASCGHYVIGVSRSVTANEDPATLGCNSLVSWERLSPAFVIVNRISAIVNLAGATMMQRWSKKHRHEIMRSRLESIAAISQLLQHLPFSQRPHCVIHASSVAIYASCDDPVDEYSAPDTAADFFQAKVWRSVEQQISRYRLPGVRTVTARFGIVLGPDERMRAMLRAARMYLGATLGTGCQKISWVSATDANRAIAYLMSEPLQGAFNLVAPQVITAREFSTHIAAAVNRPVTLRIPPPLLRLLLGDLAATFTCSAAVVPARLTKSQFQWRHTNIATALGSIAQELGYQNRPVATAEQSKLPS